MNIAHREKIVLLGFLSHFPVAGVAWQTIHYLVGFQRLGYEVYYVEAHGCTPSKLMKNQADDGPMRAAAYIDAVMQRFGLADRWAYHSLYPEPRYLGMSRGQLQELYRSAALVVNLHGSHVPTAELSAVDRLIYLETDPVEVEMEIYQKKQETLDYLAPHCAFFTYGENLGKTDCLVPVPNPFKFLPTRQPVVMDFWENHGCSEAPVFTTIGNWRQAWREVKFNGEIYRWSKHLEFQKFLDLPSRVSQPFELALSSANCNAEDKRLLESKGWRVRDALEFSNDLDAYRRYIAGSRGEFTVAKDQNVRLRSGWFSDRSATYLAAGRPVITQETGFSNILPTGKGLFAFSSMEEILAAVEAINANYDRHRRAALEIARECFSHEVVLGRLLDDLDLRATRPRSPLAAFPDAMRIAPLSRHPVTLPEETLLTIALIPVRTLRPIGGPSHGQVGVSVIVVTFNNLPITRLCLETALTVSGDAEFIVVDNASGDGTPSYLRDLAAKNLRVRLILNEQNVGFAAANNQGLGVATGNVLVLLNNDTIVPQQWLPRLLCHLEDDSVGAVGPVTNRIGNEAQVEVTCETYGDFVRAAERRGTDYAGRTFEIPTVTMFCLAMRREVFERVGPLDERFGMGMLEDDDYSMRMGEAGLRRICAEDVLVWHFSQASFGQLMQTGEYAELLARNQRLFEEKWGRPWKQYGRRHSPRYLEERARLRETVVAVVPEFATIAVVSKGDPALLELDGRTGWHFPQAANGVFAGHYPADDAAAIAELDQVRARGAAFLAFPATSLWWLDHYAGLSRHLAQHCRRIAANDACQIFDLRASEQTL